MLFNYVNPSPFVDPLTLSQAGTYTIVAYPWSNYTGTFTFTVYDVPSDISGAIAIGDPPYAVNITTPGQAARLTFAGTSNQ